MLLHTIIRSQCFLLWKPIIELGWEMKGFASGANVVSAPPSGEYRKAMFIFNLLKTNRNTIMWHPCSTGCEESDVECFCVWHKHVKPVQTKEWNAPANAFRPVSKAHGRAAGRCRCGWLSERWMSESFVLGRYLCRRLSSGGSELPVDQVSKRALIHMFSYRGRNTEQLKQWVTPWIWSRMAAELLDLLLEGLSSPQQVLEFMDKFHFSLEMWTSGCDERKPSVCGLNRLEVKHMFTTFQALISKNQSSNMFGFKFEAIECLIKVTLRIVSKRHYHEIMGRSCVRAALSFRFDLNKILICRPAWPNRTVRSSEWLNGLNTGGTVVSVGVCRWEAICVHTHRHRHTPPEASLFEYSLLC